MRLQQSTWIEVKEYLEKSSGIILPAGSTEQHGPTGVLGVDTFCAEAIAWRVGELSSAMVGPCLNVGMSEHHMTFSGSMSLRPSTYIALVYDCILSLAHHGFRRFFIKKYLIAIVIDIVIGLVIGLSCTTNKSAAS
jgi:creatinine amidohydrolase